MPIDPITEIIIGFLIACITYVMIRLGVHLPISFGAMGLISLVLGIVASLIADPHNSVFVIPQNIIMFVIGNALGLLGAALFEQVLRVFRQMINFIFDL